MWDDGRRVVVSETTPETDDCRAAAPLKPLFADWGEVVWVIDVSLGGVGLRGTSLPSQDDRVSLRVGPLTISGRVAWSKEAGCGIAFDLELTAEQCLIIREHREARLSVLAMEMGPLSELR
jgi:hypothetical protein